jgi:quercetin dioxygenase-like cupin family protein
MRQARILGSENVERSAGRVAANWIGAPPDLRVMHEALGTEELKINVLYFEPGVRSRPHTHSHDQVLYYASGTGVVAVDGGEDQFVRAGEFVLLPANVPHMHGASDDGPASHLSLMREVETDFDCSIPASWERWRQSGRKLVR